jgi:hypothetical protein
VLLATVRATLGTGTPNTAGWRLLGWIGACWVVFAIAAAAVRRTPERAAVPLVIVGAVALQALAVAFPPRSTDDFYRYAWDGRVQAAGIDPYRYVPVDPALAGLRDPWLFPPGCAHDVPVCTVMNHPTSPTAYPPVAEAAFWLQHVVTAPLGVDGGGARALQVAAAVLALVTTGALLLVLRRYGDPRTAVLWAWCPTVVFEAGNDAHVDVLAALLVVVAMGSAAGGRRLRAGVAAGAAIATKVLPLLVLPALVSPLTRERRRPVAVTLASCASVIGAVYLPHVLVLGARALGFLPGYLAEEGYDGRARFALLRPWLPDRVAAVVGVLLLLGLALLVARRTDPRRPWTGGVLMVGVAFALGGVTYPWYPLLLVVLVALDGRAEWLAVAAAAYPGYFTGALHLPFGTTQRVTDGAALLIVVVVTWLRRRPMTRAVEDRVVILS